MVRSVIVVAVILLAFVAGGCDDLRDVSESAVSLPTEPTRVDLFLGAPELIRGLDARSFEVRDDALAIAPWAESATKARAARVITNVIDLGGEADISLPTLITDLHVRTFGRTPGRGRIVTWLRHGSTYFQPADWTDWQVISSLTGPQKSAPSTQLDLGDDCYVQFCADVAGEKGQPGQPAPTLGGLAVSFVRQSRQRFEPPIEVPSAGLERIVRSTISFDYGRPDQPDLLWLRKNCRLDDLVAKPKDEFARVIALNDWVSRRPAKLWSPVATLGDELSPWDLHKTFDLANGGTVSGGSAGYCRLFVAAATALGWPARQIVANSVDGSSRDLVEVWIDKASQWVCFVPYLGAYYVDPAGQPLCAIDARDAAEDCFRDGSATQPGMDAISRQLDNWLATTLPADVTVSSPALRIPPIRVSTNGIAFGKAAEQTRQAALDVLHGDFLWMIPHSRFGPASAQRVGPAVPCWLPAETEDLLPTMPSTLNPKPGDPTCLWTRRRADWNWTLNQAAMKLVRTGPRQITVELGNSQPFFSKYIALIDGRAQQVGSKFVWRLSRGSNTLIVTCLDEFNRDGIPSSIRVQLGK